jgi:hypothetical protein
LILKTDLSVVLSVWHDDKISRKPKAKSLMQGVNFSFLHLALSVPHKTSLFIKAKILIITVWMMT